MTITEQVAVILEAADKGILQPEDVVRWADSIIVASEEPESWLIEVSTLGATHVQDYVSRLEEHSEGRIGLRRQVELIVLAYRSGRLELLDTLALLFRVLIIDRERRERGPLEERLVDALMSWNCQEDLDAIGPLLQSRFDELFDEILPGTNEIAAVLPWKFLAEPGAAPNAAVASGKCQSSLLTLLRDRKACRCSSQTAGSISAPR